MVTILPPLYGKPQPSQEQTRDGDQAFYNSQQWRNVRAQHRRQEPLCRQCKQKGIVKAAQMVDHIKPIRQGGERLDPSNLMALCNTCHAQKRNSERSKNG